MKPTKETFTLYILRTTANTLYIGQTNNLEKRLSEHKSKTKRASKYIRSHQDFSLVYQETHSTRSEVMKREIELKKFTKKQKEELISTYKLLT